MCHDASGYQALHFPYQTRPKQKLIAPTIKIPTSNRCNSPHFMLY